MTAESETSSCIWRHLAAGRPRSPFARLIALDFWDGPKSGVLWSDACSASIRFDFLEGDLLQDVRIYSLAALPPDAFSRLTEICSASIVAPPRQSWTEWWVVWDFPSDVARKEANEAVERLLEAASAPFAVIASSSLLEGIAAAREISREDIPLVAGALRERGTDWPTAVQLEEKRPLPEWFAYLGLDRDAKRDP